ncbi:HPr family phosphocarrier protein [Desulfobulbus sp. TB]|nr:HPr family phosphocarrier protein [Desulfobulbus sp. TB]
MKTVSWTSTVANPNGVHCRVAERLIRVIDNYEASVQIISPETACTSILELLSLGLVQGSQVQFTAQGPDAEQVAVAVEQILSESASSEPEFFIKEP